MIRELPIHDGWNVLDDNLLACSEQHIRAVFAMLTRQERQVAFTGGLEAKRLTDWHVDLLASLKRRPRIFFAYDPGDELEPLKVAFGKLWQAGFTAASHNLACYVLIGFPKDTPSLAYERLERVKEIGLMPFAMLYRDKSGRLPEPQREWRTLQRSWARPAAIYAREAVP